jgi:geranylgeranyl diphosphate synthase, type I
VAESTRLVDRVDERLDEFCSEHASILLSISDDLTPLAEISRRFVSGGKRFRALFCYWGWQSVGTDGFDPFADPDRPDLKPVVDAAAGLELLHAAALVHDDLIDNSDTRRGSPSAHRLFQSVHTESTWAGDAPAFGRASALLLGDLLLGWSDEILDEGLGLLEDRAAARAARSEYMRMRTEVILGQYLDILEESAWLRHDDPSLRQRAERVIIYKSAKYSVEAPLAIGAAIGGGSAAQRRALHEFGLPLGIAYQLRDDLLGVFGDAEITGKPSGDDLREGKRTVLVAIARERLASGQRRLFDELIGDPELDDQQIGMLQRTLRQCGAVDEVEALIARNVIRATTALTDAPLTARSRAELGALAETVTRRTS